MLFKKGRGALCVCIWNQGGGGPKMFGNRWRKWTWLPNKRACLNLAYSWTSRERSRTVGGVKTVTCCDGLVGPCALHILAIWKLRPFVNVSPSVRGFT